MPKDNFFKLDQEKRDRIINAAYDEFITYKSNYKKASIKRIVKEADISIGSFYEYFDDKDDLFLFLINNIADKKQKYVFNEKDNIKDIFLKILKISEDNSILDDREKELLDVLSSNDNDDLIKKFYFDYALANFMELNLNRLKRDMNKGLLNESIDIEFASYLLTTAEYNIIKYWYYKGITDNTERLEIAHKFINMIFKGIYKQ
ncbi:MAG TPA: TetR/AcrR family transcriptional regulator [Clostridiales bacterium]|uniref:TetR/AcrR family transcriptional regulator n=1 Tax=Lutispora sp. TaxID=2828727 RepID=UPI0016B7E9C7|nr:TetR/AcrR family transcriptional regulator [Clostridiales bacterium]HHY77920.1 TetR/AcrR family transcriptional regulator [Clostridiales bacterium]